jgi:hypothetical protein
LEFGDGEDNIDALSGDDKSKVVDTHTDGNEDPSSGDAPKREWHDLRRPKATKSKSLGRRPASKRTEITYNRVITAIYVWQVALNGICV